jgi:DNA-binding XRE family transcriptional regulator
MEKPIQEFKRLLKHSLPHCAITVDAPDHAGGNWLVDVTVGKRRQTVEYRPSKGFGLFREHAGYGEGPAEVYRTPERAAQRLVQLMTAAHRKGTHLNFKDIRELYGHSQVQLARKVGIKQSAISRFEKRDEVKLSTLAAAIKALGGKLELRARFADSDVAISLPSSKG